MYKDPVNEKQKQAWREIQLADRLLELNRYAHAFSPDDDREAILSRRIFPNYAAITIKEKILFSFGVVFFLAVMWYVTIEKMIELVF